ncbi:MAG: alpha-glucosidase [Lachnospiraceae bacterium]|nr:alpha-glucosidase [Lachnospiraceae bacterium]
MSERWWQRSVVYQVYPRSFQDSNGDGIGDLKGITSRLPYIAELGADVIWLSPVYQSPNDDNGYDISDYQAIMEEFGTMEDFDEMLAEAHRLGLHIVMDLVVNHSSDEHHWFVESRKSKDNPYRDYYIWRDPKDGGAPNNLGSCFGGTAWEYDEASGQYYLHLFSKKQPDLNWENEKVRDEIFTMMDWWMQKGIDGFRMDVISLISKDQSFPDYEPDASGFGNHRECANGPREHEFLREMNRRVLSKYDCITVGECPGVGIEEAKEYANIDGSELSMVFEFDHVSVDVDPDLGRYGKVVPLDLPKLKSILSSWQTGLQGKAWNSLFWENHDQPRVVSRWGSDATEEFREKSAKMLGTCLHMLQGTPYVFQGEELGMTNYPWTSADEIVDCESKGNYLHFVKEGILPEAEAFDVLRQQTRDNARTPMQWDASEMAGFTTGTPWRPVHPNHTTVNAETELADPNSVFHYYQKLIALRKQYDIITNGSFELLEADHPDLFVYTRTLGDEKLLTVCSFSGKPVAWKMPAAFAAAETLISNYGEIRTDAEELRPYEAYVLRIAE